MFLFTYTAAAIALFAFMAAFFVFKKRHDDLGRYCVWYIVCIGFWVGGNALADVSTTDTVLRFWCGICLIAGTGLISFYLCFIESFITNTVVPLQKKIIFFIPTLVFSAVAFTHVYVVETIFTPGQPAQMIPGTVVAYCVLLFTTFGPVYGLVRLLMYYRRTTYMVQKQIFYLAIGFSALLINGTIFTIILPFVGEFRFYTLGPQTSAITIICIAYAILRHRLLDIRVALQLGIIYTTLVVCLSAIYLAVLYTILYFSGNVIIPYIASSLLTTLIGVFSLPFFERRLRSLTDSWFFKRTYTYSEALEQLSEITSHSIEGVEIILNTSKQLEDILRATNVHYALIPEYTQAFLRSATLSNTNELFAIPHLSTIRSVQLAKAHSSLLDPNRKTLCIPLIVEGDFIGNIALGVHKSQAPYSDQDVHLLTTFSHQAALALKKAFLFEQVRDYSENLSQKVTERTKELQLLQETQAQTMHDISHELQTPLTVMKGELDLIRSSFPDDRPLAVFEKSVDRISSFVSALLNLARIGTPGTHVKKVPFSLSKVLEEVVEYVRILAEQEHIHVQASIQKHIMMYGHRNQMEEVVTNLLSNAIKYIAPPKHIYVTLRTTKEQIILIVRDTGIGIPTEELPLLGKRFYRSNHSQTHRGTGLGLAICFKAIEHHQGAIAIDSEVGKGTTVTITLPLYVKES